MHRETESEDATMGKVKYSEEMKLPSNEAGQRIRRQSVEELVARNKSLEKELKRKEKELADEKGKVEILKKSLHIFIQPPE